jgi:hypothetical protein
LICIYHIMYVTYVLGPAPTGCHRCCELSGNPCSQRGPQGGYPLCASVWTKNISVHIYIYICIYMIICVYDSIDYIYMLLLYIYDYIYIYIWLYTYIHISFTCMYACMWWTVMYKMFIINGGTHDVAWVFQHCEIFHIWYHLIHIE